MMHKLKNVHRVSVVNAASAVVEVAVNAASNAVIAKKPATTTQKA